MEISEDLKTVIRKSCQVKFIFIVLFILHILVKNIYIYIYRAG